jgi:ABC-type Fe3+ transport system substrate-binding protein
MSDHMKKNILAMTVDEICQTYNGSLSVFIENGFSQFKDEDFFGKVAPFLNLRQALAGRGIDEKQFLSLLKPFEDNGSFQDYEIHDRFPPFVALLPCGLRNPFMKLFENFTQSAGNNFESMIEGNVNHELSYYDYIDQVDSIDSLPDLMITSDINSLFHSNFQEKFINEHYFSPAPPMVNPLYDCSKMTDPEGKYSFIACNILVLAVDHERLGRRPVPERWEDLMDPLYENSLGIRGEDNFYCHSVTLPFYLLYGKESMAKLERSIHSCYHPAEMVKALNSKKEDRPAMFILPLFFAEKITDRERVSILFPEEGALTSPVSYFVKKEKARELKSLLDFLQSNEVAELCEGLHCPAAYSEKSTSIPQDVPLYWIGWDTVRNSDMGEIKKKIDKLFIEARL